MRFEIKGEYMTEPGIEGVSTTVRPQPPLISNYALVVTVYILYFFGFLTAITALVGVIIAYLQQNNTDPVCQSHFRFQVRTFWIGLVYLVAGLLTIHRNWRVRFALVDHLDTDEVREGSARIEYRRADTQPELMVVW